MNSIETCGSLHEITEKITASYERLGGFNYIDREHFPSRDMVVDIMQDILTILFPGFIGKKDIKEEFSSIYIDSVVNGLYIKLKTEIYRSLLYRCKLTDCDSNACRMQAETTTMAFLSEIPRLRNLLKMDITAAYDGDPAATGYEEIIICYPCITAMAAQRCAHELYVREVPIIPRIMTEWAHHRTGIDIHPGAKIGEFFFIDHGTGVVIGETAQIGNNVKIYQGVTLGALSFPKDESGNIIRGKKRHPTIEDRVTIYAGATILGGETVIGNNSVIGANTFVVHSVPPNTKLLGSAK